LISRSWYFGIARPVVVVVVEAAEERLERLLLGRGTP
jgi:hypothetical protein